MHPLQRILVFISASLLAFAFLFPVWNIDIWAPQYPEGLSMQICVNDITGNVDQINILNHYIGMKKIDPRTIPELRLLPIAISALIVFGIASALMGRQRVAYAWYFTLLLFLVVSLLDFYKWGYDYGHILDPDAPIKVPGMSYQPPLIGCKTLLNIDACSMPHVGGYIMALAYLLGFVGVFWGKLSRFFGQRGAQRLNLKRSALSLLLLFVVSCTSSSAIQYGHDTCETCKMLISDNHFGAEVITKKGRTLTFDSVPCLLKYLARERDSVKSVFVIDYLKPGQLVAVEKAHFLTASDINGPMGPGPIASLNKSEIENLKMKKSGEIVTWQHVLSSASSSH